MLPDGTDAAELPNPHVEWGNAWIVPDDSKDRLER